MNSENKLITRKKAAQLLSISIRTLDRLTANHPDKIRKVFVGGSVRIPLVDITRISEEGL